jgi:hypothetical protein
MGGQAGNGTGCDTLKSGRGWIKRPAGVHL